MKYFILLGGFAGFALTLASSLLAGTDSSIALRDAMFGCLIGAALLRGFRTVMMHQARLVLAEKARVRKELAAVTVNTEETPA